LIPPLNLRGTAEELDNGFLKVFLHHCKPLRDYGGYGKLHEATGRSQKEICNGKRKTDKEKKEKEAKEKKYKDAFQKAEALEKEGKYKEAWSALPKVSENPDFAETIRKKQAEYEKHFAPSLFTEPANENV
jgi:hypothetical protein